MTMLSMRTGQKREEITGIVDRLVADANSKPPTTDNPWQPNWRFKGYAQPFGDAVSPTSAWGENTLDLDYAGAQSDSERPPNKNMADDMKKIRNLG